MTIAFAALLIGVAVAALLLALGTYIWVNRTPSPNERFDEHGRVPLFGVDLVATPAQSNAVITDMPPPLREIRIPDAPSGARGQAAPPGANPPAIEDSDVPDREKVASGADGLANTSTDFDPHANYRPRIVRTHSEPAPAPVQPILIDTAAPDTGLSPAALNTPTSPPQPASAERARGDEGMPGATEPARHLQSDQRIGGSGWGKTPGWPLPEAQTPRFVPPIPDLRPADPAPENGNGVTADGVPGSMIEGHRLRYSTPAEGTLQFLPGRLEITSGLDTGREIRFVKLPGPSGTEVTFGRNEGPLYRHIQLRDQTVSREHARMSLIDGHWLLTNLSKTNPVAHNGRVLGPGEHQLLADGDRLDMGEVIFSFRSR